MRRALLPLVLLAGACGSGQQTPHEPPAVNAARAVPAPAPPPPAAPATDPARALPDDNMVQGWLVGLSPAQRRAFDLGYRDCSSGRYAPANHLEAYRIGCAAARDDAPGGRPEG